MKTYNLILFIVFTLFVNCKSQQPQTTIKMRTFDKEKFNAGIKQREAQNPAFKNSTNRNESYQYKEGDTLITLSKQDNGYYREDQKVSNSVRKKIYIFYNDTNSLAYEGEEFNGTNIGIHRKYSKEGVLTEEINYDIELKSLGFLTKQEMNTIMINTFGIDIEREDELKQIRLTKRDSRDVWEIACKAHPEKQINSDYAYIFDAKTGAFIGKEVFILY